MQARLYDLTVPGYIPSAGNSKRCYITERQPSSLRRSCQRYRAHCLHLTAADQYVTLTLYRS
eukprot:14436-Eustigmatos_ZCMA.PRE.1